MKPTEMELELARLQLEGLQKLCSEQEKKIDKLKKALDNYETHVDGLENYIRRLQDDGRKDV